MAEATFQKEVLTKLNIMEKNITSLKSEMVHIMEYIEDSRLTEEEKQLLKESYEHEKEGKLISSKDLKKKLEP